MDYDDWRLPNTKELQSIVDYKRAPDAADPTRRAAAIDHIFNVTEMESWYWTGTSLLESSDAGQGGYVCFGQAYGVYSGKSVNVHGAGAQRSDPKDGDPGHYPDVFGPQNVQIRIFNYVRAMPTVSDIPVASTTGDTWVFF